MTDNAGASQAVIQAFFRLQLVEAMDGTLFRRLCERWTTESRGPPGPRT